MGTKGSKNTPITARINTGLFNQKKGVREPLLDVGLRVFTGIIKLKIFHPPVK